MTTVTRERAREAVRLAEADPRKAATLATRVARQARVERDDEAAAIAARAYGLAVLHSKDVDRAIKSLRQAVAFGIRAGSVRVTAEARMTLAFALGDRGKATAAVHEIDAALRDLDGVEHARALAQKAAILHQVGQYDGALRFYRESLPILRRFKDEHWFNLVLMNRGLLHAQRQEFAAAESDLHQAEAFCEELGLDLSLGFVQQNLGLVHALRGDVIAALRYLDRAEDRLRAHGAQLGTLLADRTELLLSVRLAAEARETAEQAVLELRREKRLIALPEVRLLLARAASLLGDHAGARLEARRAGREFRRQQRPEGAELAQLMELACTRAGRMPVRASLGQVQAVVEAVAAAGFPSAAIEGRLLAADLAQRRRQPDRARIHLRTASQARRQGPAILRARGWYAEAKLRLVDGDRAGAARGLRAGLRTLDDHRDAFGASDLRARLAGHRTDLAELGLRIALQDGRPRRVFEWAERGRASHLLHRPARPPDDKELADLLAKLRLTVLDIDDARKAGQGTAALVRRQVKLERQIRDHSRTHGDDGRPRERRGPVRIAGLAEALGDRALLEYVQVDGELTAVSVVGGRLRLRRIGPAAEVRDLIERLQFALHRLLRGGAEGSRSAAVALLRHAARRLDAVLLGPMVEVADRPLVVVPTGSLQSMPWSLLPSCGGRPVAVTPSATLWHLASSRSADGTGHVAVAAGPDLPGARAEAVEVARIHHTAALVDPDATATAVLASLTGAGLGHLAAHGHLVSDNPLFSDLRLSDGPLVVYDLERLDLAPHTVVLAACDSGRSVVYAGDELLGLSATLLARGSTQLVASVLPVPDAETAPLMIALHRRLARGRPPAVALAEAQQEVADSVSAVAAAAGFVCLGAGFVAPPLARPVTPYLPSQPQASGKRTEVRA
jgi:tetratricopeptide (TPR) repeat protein